MQKYDYTVIYKPGKELIVPDMLSRAPLPGTAEESMEKEISYHVHHVISNLPATESKLEKIRNSTNDYEHATRKFKNKTILSGLPKPRSQVNESVREYWRSIVK